MHVQINFSCDNAAFEDNLRGEISSILKLANEKLFQELSETTIRYWETTLKDSNGNTVGILKVMK